MALERGKFTRKENIALAIAAVAVALLYILRPSAYSALTRSDMGSGTMVPKYGTAEYQEFLAEFEAEYGRPWTIADQTAAIKNGGLMVMQMVLLEMSVCMAFALVHDLRCYALEKKYMPRDHMPATAQAARTALHLAFLAMFLCGAFFAVAAYVTPIT